MPFDLTPQIVIVLAVALFGAALVRGYSGFGFSAIFIAVAALVTNPVPLIPVVFLCEIAMTALQARGIRGHVDWSRALWLLAGAAVALPFAIFGMLALPVPAVRLVISVVIGAMALVLLSGWSLKTRLPLPAHAGVGLLAGTANAAGVGGLPVAACLGAQPIPAATFRATMIVFLTGIDLMTLPLMALGGNVTGDTFLAAVIAAPILAVGILLGNRRFAAAPPAAFRRFAIWLLLALSMLGLIRALA
ncbi:sulfite exporter TauE/SafE family protein [Loktanella sp. SALINAS62]|uniref:sulfite exporter TauE/SafE family protein n=1 Tax=Loktanella sp. SALINAS62 TaxID=2706124 RepID=UPI001B8C222F|nr:sulfite exporter TauE/SafE family protein [Loktanella sp. SALINAS62]MBS1304314.1 TSUP family transporter [Loktanella sp. SALINAS62]